MNHPELNPLAQIIRIPADVPRPRKLAHLVFRTQQLNVMRDWYCAVLGAHVVFANEQIAFMTYDDEHHRVALINEPADAALAQRAGFHHAAFTYDSLAELLQTYSRLKQDGIVPHLCILHGPTVSMYYRDPDGNDIELQIDVFETADEATTWMVGQAFSNNPIGILFDPDDMVHRYRVGEPLPALIRRADM